MDEAADPAYAFGNVDILGEFSLCDERFEAAVHVSDRGEDINDGLVFEHQVKVERFMGRFDAYRIIQDSLRVFEQKEAELRARYGWPAR